MEEEAQRNPTGAPFYVRQPPLERATGLLISISNIQHLSNQALVHHAQFEAQDFNAPADPARPKPKPKPNPWTLPFDAHSKDPAFQPSNWGGLLCIAPVDDVFFRRTFIG